MIQYREEMAQGNEDFAELTWRETDVLNRVLARKKKETWIVGEQRILDGLGSRKRVGQEEG